MRTILTTARALFAEVRCPQRLLDMEEDGRLAAFGYNDNVQNNVMRQLDDAITHVTPAEAKLFFGFDKCRRAYVCPRCYFAANRDWQEEWPLLAQLRSRRLGESALHCCLSNETTTTGRQACARTECKGYVIADDLRLTCTGRQDESDAEADYAFVLSVLDAAHPYRAEPSIERLRGDEAAKRYGRNTLLIDLWTAVSITRVRPNSASDIEPIALAVGSWRHAGTKLEWLEGVDAERLPREAEPA